MPELTRQQLISEDARNTGVGSNAWLAGAIQAVKSDAAAAVSNVSNVMAQARGEIDRGLGEQTASLMSGLTYYQTAIKQAADAINKGLTDANFKLSGLTSNAAVAQNEYMRMLGLTPPSAAARIGDQVKILGQQIKSAGWANASPDIQQLIERTKTVDSLSADQRLQLKNELTNTLQNTVGGMTVANNSTVSGIQSRLDAVQANINQWQGKLTPHQNQVNVDQAAVNAAQKQLNDAQNASLPDYYARNPKTLRMELAPRPQSEIDQFNREKAGRIQSAQTQLAATQKALSASQNQLNTTKNTIASLTSQAKPISEELTGAQQLVGSQLGNLKTQTNTVLQQFEGAWSPGYTGDQVSSIITTTPGYQFQVDQGMQAVSRSAAARGMLGSGNTLFALQEFGQKLAQNVYQTYLGNLQTVVDQGKDATIQASQNTMTAGGLLAQLEEKGGQAGMLTYGDIGKAQADAAKSRAATYNPVADAYVQTAKQVADTSMGLASLAGNIQLGWQTMDTQRYLADQQSLAQMGSRADAYQATSNDLAQRQNEFQYQVYKDQQGYLGYKEGQQAGSEANYQASTGANNQAPTGANGLAPTGANSIQGGKY